MIFPLHFLRRGEGALEGLGVGVGRGQLLEPLQGDLVPGEEPLDVAGPPASKV